MPVGELLQRISSRELTEWLAYFKVVNAHTRRARRRADGERAGGQTHRGAMEEIELRSMFRAHNERLAQKEGERADPS